MRRVRLFSCSKRLWQLEKSKAWLWEDVSFVFEKKDLAAGWLASRRHVVRRANLDCAAHHVSFTLLGALAGSCSLEELNLTVASMEVGVFLG